MESGNTEKTKRPAMKLSARNQLKGVIVDIVKGATTAHVRIDIGGAILTASITNEAVEELKLAKGQPAIAVVKATDVMVGVED
jgi:molybdopterin-binding protein